MPFTLFCIAIPKHERELIFLSMQVTLGISTLLSYVPVSLASAHQAGALTLLSFMMLLNHIVRKPSPALLKSLASLPKSSH